MDRRDIQEIVRKEIIKSVMQSQEFLVVGNWKMNKTKQEVISFLDEVSNHDFGEKNTIIIAPPSPYLYLFLIRCLYPLHPMFSSISCSM